MSHGFYVWTAYGVVLLVMGVEVLALLRKRRSLRQPKGGNPEVRS